VAPDGTSTATTLDTREDGTCPVPGRRPDGLRDARPDASDAVGHWLARAAHMEAASVFAFESLARELTELGAPAALVDAARRSADDERRHARMMGRLAERAGAAVPAVEVEAPRARTAFAIARENAVEGCVHETWAAMEALAQSERAARPGVAATMGAIADDEMRHASLAWQVAAWLEPRLSEAERAAVREAREGARAALEARVARGYDRGLGEALGLPPPALAARLVASLHAALG
jgi:rubrerythrin